MRRTAAFIAAGLMSAATPPLIAPAAAQDAQIAIQGSNTVGGALMPALLKSFGAANGVDMRVDPGSETPARLSMTGFRGEAPVISISLERLGSSTSFKGLLAGTADIGMSSRVIKDVEAEALGGDMRGEDSEHVVALDGLAVIVSPANPLNTITPKEIADIFAGRITDWRELGFSVGPISVNGRDSQSGTFDTFNSLALKPFGVEISETAQRYYSSDELAAVVAADPLAIGFVSLSQVGAAKPLALALDCGLIIGPGEFSVKSEEYPLSRRLHLYTKGVPTNRAAQALVDFALSDAAQPTIKAVGFENQALAMQRGAPFADRVFSAVGLAGGAAEKRSVREFIDVASNAERLSLTFRFIRGSDLLDAKSLADAGRLARWLSQAENADAKVKLVGFSDDLGAFSDNLRLTEGRAEAVKRALLINVSPGFDASRVETMGFGEIAPVSCNTSERGRAGNRRVEVWVSRGS